jgi:Domain of unknown function (DUF222)
MPAEPVPADLGWDDDLAWLDQDPMPAADRVAWLDRLAESDDPPEPEEYEDFEPLTAAELAGIGEATADEMLAAEAVMTGRRGPGHSGSARILPGEWSSPAAAFGPGMALDVMPGCPGLALSADAAVGDDGRFAGVSDAELIGVICAWDRVEAHVAAQKLAAIAELHRRRPDPEGAGCDEFAARELGAALGESRGRAEELLHVASELETRLPGTRAALRDGTIGFVGRVNLTVPLATVLDLADRPGEVPGIGPVDPWLARDLATSAAVNPKTTWCITVTDRHGRAVGHGCARPEPKRHRKRKGPGPPRDGTAFSFTPASRDGPPGGHGTWRLRTPGDGPDLIIELDPLTTENCDHRFQARGHDPGVPLRRLAQVRHATCTAPGCRRPAASCDFDHNTPYEAGGLTCLCNGGPKCRQDHRLKQHPKWHVDQLPDGTFRWTTPSGRTYTTEPTRYPI